MAKSFPIIGLLFVAALALAAPAPTKNIVELAAGIPDLSTLVTALKAGKLTTRLSGHGAEDPWAPNRGAGPFTVFAPTNEAFKALPSATLTSLLDPKNIKQLDAILEYHVIAGAAVYAGDLKASQDVTTLQGNRLHITKVGASVTVQKASVTMADVQASNGVVHVINGVLMPPAKNIVELAAGIPDLSTFVTALKASFGTLVSILTVDPWQAPFTVFAPTNEAFAALPKATLASLLEPANIRKLTSILEYHVLLKAALYTEDLKASQDVTTLQGNRLHIAKVDGSVTVQKASVTMANVQASNGVVHVINGVLMPLGGHDLAQTSIDDAGIRVDTMRMSGFTATGFQLHLLAVMNNRSPLAAETREATVTMRFNGASVGSTTLPAQSLPAGGESKLDIQQPVVVAAEQQVAFTKLAAALLTQKEVKLTLHAKVNVHALGITFKDLTLDKDVSLKGFNGFSDPAPLVVSSSVVNTTKDTITMKLDIRLTNAASVAIGDLGPLSLKLKSGNTILGNATTNGSVNLEFGVNKYSAIALLTRPHDKDHDKDIHDKAVFAALLSNYSSGLPSTVQMQGLGTDSTPKLLHDALEKLNTQGVLPGLSETLVEVAVDTDFHLPGNADIDPEECGHLGNKTQNITFKIDFVLRNVLDVPLTVSTLDLSATWLGSQLQGASTGPPPFPAGCAPVSPVDAVRVLNGKNKNANIFISPHQEIVFSQTMCDLNGPGGNVDKYIEFIFCMNYLAEESLTNGKPFTAKFGASGTLNGCLGEYCTEIDYSQKSLEAVNTVPAELPKPLQPVLNQLHGAPNLATLDAALKASGFAEQFTGALSGAGPFTIFAPTDEAFAKLPVPLLQMLLEPKNLKALQSLLKYHVVVGKTVLSEHLTDKESIETFEGKNVTVRVTSSGIVINQANVNGPEKNASNGVIHVIDSVLVPPDAKLPSLPTKNIVELASNVSELSALVSALKAGNLVTALSGKGPFTVFAPTNKAFAALPSATLTHLLEPKNIKELDFVLKFHVVPGAVYAEDLKASQHVKTLQGQDLTIIKSGGSVTVQNAKVVQADVFALNGVVHVINGVLMPPTKNIVELAAGIADLSTLVTAL